LTSTQATAFTTVAIPGITPDAIAKLNISGFDANNGSGSSATTGVSRDISVLTNEQFQKLTAAQVALINPTQAPMILASQIEGVKTLGSLANNSGTSSLSIPVLDTAVVAALETAQISRFDAARLEAFTVVQAQKFNSDVTDWAYSKGYSVVSAATGSEVKGITTGTTVTGAAAASTITAGKNAVTIVGGAGTDTINGSPKDDTISTGGTATGDKVYAGAGADTITLTGSTQALLLAATIDGGDGNDTLVLGTAALDIIDAGFVAVSSIETLELTGISSVVLATNAAAAGITKVVAGAGATSITTSSAIATLTIDADDIADDTALTLVDSGVTDFTVINLEGDLTLTTLDATSSVTATFSNIAGNGATVAAGTVGDLVLVGGDAGDTITVTGFTGATLTGSVAKFDITAAAGAQTIVGGALADTITGGDGLDKLTGGAGIDKFVLAALAADADTITDFVKGTDIIDLSAATAATTLTIGAQVAFDTTTLATNIAAVDTAADTAAPVYYIKNTAGAAGVMSLADIETAIAAGSAATGEVVVLIDNGTSTSIYFDAAAETDAVSGAGLILVGTLTGITGATALATGDLVSV
jgi:Ca2+-binding RTX toxin-like protein